MDEQAQPAAPEAARADGSGSGATEREPAGIGEAEARAKLDALREQVHRFAPAARPVNGRTPGRRHVDTSPLSAVDPAALDAAVNRALAERDRRQAEAAAQAERDRAEALAHGGPCRYCGVTMSWEHDPEHDRAIGRWYADVCAWCEDDRAWGIAGRTDSELRDLVLRRLLPYDLTREYGLGFLAEAAGFRWWREVPGAPSSATERFAYVDREALAARLADRKSVV